MNYDMEISSLKADVRGNQEKIDELESAKRRLEPIINHAGNLINYIPQIQYQEWRGVTVTYAEPELDALTDLLKQRVQQLEDTYEEIRQMIRRLEDSVDDDSSLIRKYEYQKEEDEKYD